MEKEVGKIAKVPNVKGVVRTVLQCQPKVVKSADDDNFNPRWCYACMTGWFWKAPWQKVVLLYPS
jgi:hypothetical protein